MSESSKNKKIKAACAIISSLFIQITKWDEKL